MGKTIRKDRDDKPYKEGRTKGMRTYRCRCSWCMGKKNVQSKSQIKQFKCDMKYIDDLLNPDS